MRLAITADWLVTPGGAERVIEQMCTLFPDAPIFTTVQKCFFDRDVRVSSLQKWRNVSHRLLLPWMPRAVESWDLSAFDVILSSSHAVAKGCIPKSPARHICYCHTPMRYAWEMEEKYLDDFGLVGPVRSLVKWQLKKLRHWDRTTAKRVDTFIANSHTVQKRIERVYGRKSIVLHPPVHGRFFEVEKEEKGYFLTVGRLVPYKRVDLLILAANHMGIPLKIAGTGPDMKRLQSLAGETVEFLGYVPEEDLPALYANAKGFLFCAEEDAGIVPLEAQACGTPVIAFGKGGALDTVRVDETGLFFEEQTRDAVIDGITRFSSMHFDANHIRLHAQEFSSARFREKLSAIIQEAVL